MSDGIVRKQDFAAMTGVTPGRVSQWVSVAKQQLRKNLDIDQRLGANAKARLDAQKPAASGREAPPGAGIPPSLPEAASGATEAPDTLEDRIKIQRLAQLSLANRKGRGSGGAFRSLSQNG